MDREAIAGGIGRRVNEDGESFGTELFINPLTNLRRGIEFSIVSYS